ncbi:MAG: PAS domain S-box protein, partial [Candidatus Delongbacteria bacterium]
MHEIDKNNDNFKILFEQAPLGYQSLDIDGNFLEVNQKWLDTFGYEKNEVIGKWFGDFLTPEYKEAFKKNFKKFKDQG